MSKNSKTVTVISIIIVVAVLLGLAVFMGNIFKNSGDDASSKKSGEMSTTEGGSIEHPIAIIEADLSLTGGEFAQKYSGKHISFDGLLQGTSSIKGAAKPHATIVFGDSIDSGVFSDGSLFWVAAGSNTFSDDLRAFASDNNSPYETNDYPKVHVTAKVSKFDENHSAVQLEPITNIDGESPSVISR